MHIVPSPSRLPIYTTSHLHHQSLFSLLHLWPTSKSPLPTTKDVQNHHRVFVRAQRNSYPFSMPRRNGTSTRNSPLKGLLQLHVSFPIKTQRKDKEIHLRHPALQSNKQRQVRWLQDQTRTSKCPRNHGSRSHPSRTLSSQSRNRRIFARVQALGYQAGFQMFSLHCWAP